MDKIEVLLSDVISSSLTAVLLLFHRNKQRDVTLLHQAQLLTLENDVMVLRCCRLGLKNLETSAIVEQLDKSILDVMTSHIKRLQEVVRHVPQQLLEDDHSQLDAMLNTFHSRCTEFVQDILEKTTTVSETFVDIPFDAQDNSLPRNVASTSQYVLNFSDENVTKICDVSQFLELGSKFDILSPKTLTAMLAYISK